MQNSSIVKQALSQHETSLEQIGAGRWTHIKRRATRLCCAGAALVATIGIAVPSFAMGRGEDIPPHPNSLPAEGDPEEEPDVASGQRKVWYGWQTLLADGAALGFTMGVAIGASEAPVALVGGTTLYAVGGPTVHFAHGNVGKGFVSFGLRVGLPAVGMLSGILLELATCSGSWGCGLVGGMVGLGAGGITAIVIDASVVAYDKVPTRRSTKTVAAPGMMMVRPHVSHDRAGLSLLGLF
jgi:hypothetical protein